MARKSVFEMDQIEYVSSAKPFSIDASFSNVRSVRIKPAWLAHTTPDVLFEVLQLTHATESICDANPKNEINNLNHALNYVHKNPVIIVFAKIDLESF